jgi:hypothetical protein
MSGSEEHLSELFGDRVSFHLLQRETLGADAFALARDDGRALQGVRRPDGRPGHRQRAQVLVRSGESFEGGVRGLHGLLPGRARVGQHGHLRARGGRPELRQRAVLAVEGVDLDVRPDVPDRAEAVLGHLERLSGGASW